MGNVYLSLGVGLLLLGDVGVGKDGFDGLGLLEGDIGGSSNSEQVLHALGNAGKHRILRRMGAGLVGNVDTGIHQVSDVLGLDLLLREFFPLKVDRASNRQLGDGTDQLGDFSRNEWGGC